MKQWIKIIALNLVFFLAFLFGFLNENKDPMQIISHMELAFLIVPIPFSVFYGFYSTKLTKSILWPNLVFALLMLSFSAWVNYYTNIGADIAIGVLCCLISFLSSAITDSLGKQNQSAQNVLNYAEKSEKYENFSVDFKEFIYWCISNEKQPSFARARGDVRYKEIIRKIKGEELETAKQIIREKLAQSNEVFLVKLAEYCDDALAIPLIENAINFYKNKNKNNCVDFCYEISTCQKALKHLNRKGK